VERFLYWQTHGSWREHDAPWERELRDLSELRLEALRRRFLEGCGLDHDTPRHRAMITTQDGRLLGWVSRYPHRRRPEQWCIGIAICEDEHLNRGAGTEALRLWISYLFSTSDVHRIGLDTWSSNPRMMRVAEKLGFAYEGAERELVEWQGHRLDWLHYGLLRREWAARQSAEAGRGSPGLSERPTGNRSTP
jgi:RimJ/RimL family protein N-acetyltransferase